MKKLACLKIRKVCTQCYSSFKPTRYFDNICNACRDKIKKSVDLFRKIALDTVQQERGRLFKNLARYKMKDDENRQQPII